MLHELPALGVDSPHLHARKLGRMHANSMAQKPSGVLGGAHLCPKITAGWQADNEEAVACGLSLLWQQRWQRRR